MHSDSLEVRLLATIELLASVLDPEPGRDCIEFSCSSTGKAAASVYLRHHITTTQVAALFEALSLPERTRTVFWLLFSRIPAERHMAQVALDGGFSVFFKTDVPTAALGPLAEALSLTNGSATIIDFFTSVEQTACGLAVETSARGRFRLRLYYMAAGPKAVASTAQAIGPAVIASRRRAEIEALTRELLAPQNLAVINLGVAAGAGFSAKFEFPNVPLELPSAVLDLNRTERSTLARACKMARRLGEQKFSYFGVRYARHQPREITLYVDARHALTMPASNLTSRE